MQYTDMRNEQYNYLDLERLVYVALMMCVVKKDV